MMRLMPQELELKSTLYYPLKIRFNEHDVVIEQRVNVHSMIRNGLLFENLKIAREDIPKLIELLISIGA